MGIMVPGNGSTGRNMVEYYKGQQCPYINKPVLCQEGYCIRCSIYEEYKKNRKEDDEYNNIQHQEAYLGW